MEYDLNISKKHEALNIVVDKQYKLLKKSIGREIFRTFETSLRDINGDVDYYEAKRLYKDIVEETIVNLRYRLLLIGVYTINDLIDEEYKCILSLKYENEKLKKEVDFLRKILNQK